LNSALKDVLEGSHDPGRDRGDQQWLRQSAINLLLDGYEAGVRDQKALADNALRIMGFGPSNRAVIKHRPADGKLRSCNLRAEPRRKRRVDERT
jgi:hypothetical protein